MLCKSGIGKKIRNLPLEIPLGQESSRRPQGWCSRGRFLQSLRRAEDGAGGQREIAPTRGVRSLEGGKEGKPALAAALPCRWLCGRWSRLLSSSSSACCGAAAVSATGAESRPDPLTCRAAWPCPPRFALPHGTAGQHGPRVSPPLSPDGHRVPRAWLPQRSSSRRCSPALGAPARAAVRVAAGARPGFTARGGRMRTGGRRAFGLVSPKNGWKNLSGKQGWIEQQCLRRGRPELAIATGTAAP